MQFLFVHNIGVIAIQGYIEHGGDVLLCYKCLAPQGQNATMIYISAVDVTLTAHTGIATGYVERECDE